LKKKQRSMSKASFKKNTNTGTSISLTLLYPLAAIAVLIILWQTACGLKLMPSFMLPSPMAVVRAFINDFSLISSHMGITVFEGASGLLISVAVSFVLSIVMDSVSPLKKAVYPLLVLSQTVPVIAIAPLLVLWLGYGITPRIVLVVIMCFFPVTIGLLDGFASCDEDYINLLKTMRASRFDIFAHAKLPMALPSFFSSLKISAAYSVIGAVIAEWVGGSAGLGVYMLRVRKSYSFDKMFAVIFLIMILSLLLMAIISILKKIFINYEGR